LNDIQWYENKIKEMEEGVTSTEFNKLHKEMEFYKARCSEEMELVKEQKVYYKKLIAHLATEDII